MLTSGILGSIIDVLSGTLNSSTGLGITGVAGSTTGVLTSGILGSIIGVLSGTLNSSTGLGITGVVGSTTGVLTFGILGSIIGVLSGTFNSSTELGIADTLGSITCVCCVSNVSTAGCDSYFVPHIRQKSSPGSIGVPHFPHFIYTPPYSNIYKLIIP